MSTFTVQSMGDEPTLEDVVDAYERFRKEATWIFDRNIDFKNIQVDGIIAKNIKAGSIETDKLAAGAVTAEKITVNQLSAIAADLGHITAGLVEAIEIFGSYIATANGTFPRVEISSDDNLFAAYLNPGDSLQVTPLYTTGSPAVLFNLSGAALGRISLIPGSFALTSAGSTDINIQSARDIVLNPLNNIKIGTQNGWSGTFEVVDDIDFTTERVYYTRVRVTKGVITDVTRL